MLRDESKSRKVWDEGIKRGICTNDTISIVTTDTIISYDTTVTVKIDSLLVYDTVVLWENKYFNIIKTKEVVKEITKTLVDSSKLNLAKAELKELKKKLLDTEDRKKMWMHNFFASLTCLVFATIGLILAIKYKK